MSSLCNPYHSSMNFCLALPPQHKKSNWAPFFQRSKANVCLSGEQAQGNRLDQKLWPVDWVRYDQLWRIVLEGWEQLLWQRAGDELWGNKSWHEEIQGGWVFLSLPDTMTLRRDTERGKTERLRDRVSKSMLGTERELLQWAERRIIEWEKEMEKLLTWNVCDRR